MTTLAPKSLRQRALDYLTKREYSYAELAQKLKAYAETSLELEDLLAEFKQCGWLSDARFTEQVVHARKTKFGSARVAYELREKGVDEDLITSAVACIKQEEFANAQAIWQKKFKNAPTSREEWAKQARFLQGRGFDVELIKKILKANVRE